MTRHEEWKNVLKITQRLHLSCLESTSDRPNRISLRKIIENRPDNPREEASTVSLKTTPQKEENIKAEEKNKKMTTLHIRKVQWHKKLSS